MASASKSRRKSAGGRSLPPIYSGPWKGVRVITGAPRVYDGSWLLAAANFHCPSPGVGAWHSRPGVTRVGTVQLGSGSNRTGQRIYEHTRTDGTIDRFLFAGGKLYSWDGNVTSPTVTDITPGAVTISTTARVYCASFFGLVIVSDGVNKPWTYNPATTTAAYIDIDGAATAWKAYGQPIVLGAKLFFILAEKGGTVYRSTFTWSEEASATTGYYQATFTNFWTLTQTADKDPRLFALAADNRGLFYFRAGSIGFVAGQVNTNFVADATHDSVSLTRGTMSPASVIQVDEDIYFLDRYLRQCRIRGGSVETLGVNAKPEPQFMYASSVNEVAESCFLPDLRLVLSDNVPAASPPAPSDSRDVWHHDTGTYQGVRTMPIPSIRAMGVVTGSGGAPITVMLGTSDYAGALAVEGYVYTFRMSLENPTTWDDALGPAGVAMARHVRIVLGEELEYDQNFHMVTAEVYNAITEASVSYGLTIVSTTDTAVTDVSGTATTALAASQYDADRVAWGVNIHGRWMVATISCASAGAPLVRINRVVAHRSLLGYNPNGF